MVMFHFICTPLGVIHASVVRAQVSGVGVKLGVGVFDGVGVLVGVEVGVFDGVGVGAGSM